MLVLAALFWLIVSAAASRPTITPNHRFSSPTNGHVLVLQNQNQNQNRSQTSFFIVDPRTTFNDLFFGAENPLFLYGMNVNVTITKDPACPATASITMFMSAHCSFSGPCDPSLLLSRLWQAPLKRTFGFLGPFGAGPVSVSGGGSLSLSSSQCGCPTSPSPSAPGSLVVYALSSAPCSVTAVVQAQMMCPLGCKNGGVCDLRRGSCICLGGFSGLDCDWWAAPASTDSLDLAPKPFSSEWNKKEVVNNVAKSDIPLPTGYMPYHVWFLASAKSNFSLSITVTAGALGAEQLVPLDRLALIATFDSPLNLSTCLRLSALPTNISSGYGRLFNMTVDMAELRAANVNNGLRVLLPFGPRFNTTFVLDAWSDRKEGIIHAALMAPAGLVIGDTTTRMITTADFRAALTMENSLAKPLSWGMFAFSFVAGVIGLKKIVALIDHRRIPPTVFSGDAKFVAGATRNRIRIWEVVTGNCVCLFAKMTKAKLSWSTVKEWFSKNTASIGVSALALSHNSRKLAAGYRNGIIKVHLTSKQSGAMAFDATLQTNKKDDDVRELVFGGTRETSVLVSTCDGAQEYHVWDARDDSLMKVVDGPAQIIHCPNDIKGCITGGMVMSPSARPTLCIAWNQASKWWKEGRTSRIDVMEFRGASALHPGFDLKTSLEWEAGKAKKVTGLCWLNLADPGPLLLVSTATSISAWNVDTGKPVWEKKVESAMNEHTDIVKTFASSNGKHAASFHADDSITLWSNLGSNIPVVSYYLGFPSVAASLAITDDERGVTVHCVGRDGVISAIPSSHFLRFESDMADLVLWPMAQICCNIFGLRRPLKTPAVIPLERCIGANEADKLAIDEQADFFTHCKKVFNGHVTNSRFDNDSDDDEGKGDGGNDNSGVASAAKKAALEKVTKFAAKAAAKNQGSSASHDGGTSMASGSEEGDGEENDVDQDGSSGKSLMEEVSGYGAGHTHASVSHHDEEEDDKPATEEDDDEDHEDEGSGDESSYGIVKRISGLGRSVGKKLKAWGETPSKPWMYGITVAFHVAEFFLRLVKVAFNLNFLHASLTVAFPKISLQPPAKVAEILSAIKGWLPNLSWSLSWSFSLTDWFSLEAFGFPHDCRIPMRELVLLMFAAFVAMFTLLVAMEGYIVVKFSTDGLINKGFRRFGVAGRSIALKVRDAIAVFLLYLLQTLLSTMTKAVDETSKLVKNGRSCSSWDASLNFSINVFSFAFLAILIEFSFVISGGLYDRPPKQLRFRGTIVALLLKPFYAIIHTFLTLAPAFLLAPPLRLLRLTFGIWTHSVVAHYNLRDLVFKNSQGKADNKTVPIIKALAQSCSLIWCLTPNTAFLVKVAEALNEAPIYVSGVTVRARSWQRALPWFVSVWTFTSCVLFLFYPSKGLLWSIFFSILPGVASSLVKDILKIKIDDNTVKANKKKQHDKP